MGILLKSKTEIDGLLGKASVAPALLNTASSGERAYEYRQGDMRIIVGYLKGSARYLAALKSSGGAFREGDVLIFLASELGGEKWTVTPSYKDAPEDTIETGPKAKKTNRPRARYFQAQRIDDEKTKRVVANYSGWVWSSKNHLFLATPYAENEVPLYIDTAAVIARLP